MFILYPSKIKSTNIIFILIYLNCLSFSNSYDSSLLNVNYFFYENNLCYINVFSNSNGDLYFEYFGNSNKIRYFYGLNSNNGKEILFQNNNVLKINFDYISMHHESKIINYLNNENYIFTYNPEYCEFIDINNPNNISYKKSQKFIFDNSNDKASYRNKIITLDNNNYLLTIIGKRPEGILPGSFLYIYTFNFNSDNIEGFSIIKGNIEGISIDYFNTTECFQTEKKYLECIINDKSNLWTNILKIYIYDLNFNELARNEIAEIEESTFIKIIYLKNEIGAYIYFDKNNIPLMQIKYLENNILKYQFEDSPIKLNGNGDYSLSKDIFLSDGIKINDNKFSIIFTSNDLTHILVCIFEMYNNDKSYYLQYFYLDLNAINTNIALNIKAFLFREHLGIALYDNNKKYPGFLMFSYPNAKPKEIILFNENSINRFPLSEYIIISNNIFGNELKGVYIENFNAKETSGVLLFSEKKNDDIHINDKLNIDDTIIFKVYNNESFPGVYELELIPIIQEPNFNIFDSLADKKIYYGESYENYYKPKVYNGKLIIVEYIVEENCFYVNHKDRFNKKKICYDGIDDHCIYEEYKYFIDDKKQCTFGECPIDYYQLNFECYREGCPSKSKQLQESKICIVEDNYFIVNEYYKTQSSNTKFNGYKYSFNNTKQYLRSCSESTKYTIYEVKSYLYNEICFVHCPENTIEDEENEICSCKYYKYYTDENNYICYSESELCKEKIPVNDIKECENSINNCINKGYKIFNNECYVNGCPINTIIDENKNNYCKCINPFYTNLENKQICSENSRCIKGYPFENTLTHECTKKCESNKLLNGECIINNQNIEADELKIITYNIKDIINDTNFDIKNEKILEGNNITYEIKSLENNNFDKSSSFLNFGECGRKIKEENNIDNFFILKYDVIQNESLSTSVEYEIYHPESRIKLDLSICNYLNIHLNMQLGQYLIDLYNQLKEYGYDMFNRNDKFYTDICSTYTSENGTDMILSDRRKTFFRDLDELCGNDCEFAGYDFDNLDLSCNCVPKNQINYEITKIKFNKNKLGSYFKISTYANLAVLKCYKLAFSKEGQKSNYGSYLILILTFFIILLMILFYYNYKKQIKNIINSGLKDIYEINSPPKKKKLSSHKKIKNNDFKTNNIIISEKSIKSFSIQENIHKESQNKFFNNNNIAKNSIINKKGIDNKKKKFNYIDEEINSLKYEDAIIYDKRSFYKYYISLIKTKHLIFFTFFRKNDFNIFFIKCILFIFSFSLYFVINALFFTDNTMHKIFEEKGLFSIVVHIPQIIYSTLISVIINKIMKLLALSERDILKMREEKNIEKALEQSKKTYSCIQIKLNIFNIVCLLFMIFFWYYISCFCAAYKNTKIILIEDTILSFTFTLLYPLILNLLPGLFRIPSLKSNKKKVLYKISNYIALI